MSRLRVTAYIAGLLTAAAVLAYPVAKLMPANAVCEAIDPTRISWFAGDFVYRTPQDFMIVAPRSEIHFGLTGQSFKCGAEFWL